MLIPLTYSVFLSNLITSTNQAHICGWFRDHGHQPQQRPYLQEGQRTQPSWTLQGTPCPANTTRCRAHIRFERCTIVQTSASLGVHECVFGCCSSKEVQRQHVIHLSMDGKGAAVPDDWEQAEGNADRPGPISVGDVHLSIPSFIC